jgi:ABC-2 type transport system permease protein
VPPSFLTGDFFPLPKVSVWTLFGQPFQIYNVLPWTRAINALRSVLIFGTGIKAVTHDVVLIIVPTIVLFIIGVVALFRTRPRAQKYLKRLFRFFRLSQAAQMAKYFV